MSKEYAAHMVDLLSPLGPVRSRAMFGGFGIYCGDVMFGLIAYDELYFRTDDQTRPAYEAMGIGPFRPDPAKPATMPYHKVPTEVLDDPDALCAHGREALAAAQRARTAKPPRKRAAKSR